MKKESPSMIPSLRLIRDLANQSDISKSIRKSTDVNYVAPAGYAYAGKNALYYAVLHNNVSAVAALLAKGANPVTVFSDKTTVLTLAAQKGHYECFKLLVEHVPNRRYSILKIQQKIQQNPNHPRHFETYVDFFQKIDKENYSQDQKKLEHIVKSRLATADEKSHSPQLESLLRKNKMLFDHYEKENHRFLVVNTIQKIKQDDKKLERTAVKPIPKPPAEPSFLSRVFCCFFPWRRTQPSFVKPTKKIREGLSPATRDHLNCK